MALGRDTAITWLGHATWLIDTPGGKRLVVDPWLDGNPSCPDDRRQLDRADIMVVTHGHGDHVGSAADVARQHGPTVVCQVETGGWLEGQGVENIVAMNKGGSTEVDGVRFTMTHAQHSSSTPDGAYAGESTGFVITVENGFRIYIAGDTNVFGDMRLIADLYSPDLAILPIGDFFTMGPREAAYAVRLLGVRHVLPSHYGTFPLLTGTVEGLRQQLQAFGVEGVEVYEPQPGETVR